MDAPFARRGLNNSGVRHNSRSSVYVRRHHLTAQSIDAVATVGGKLHGQMPSTGKVSSASLHSKNLEQSSSKSSPVLSGQRLDGKSFDMIARPSGVKAEKVHKPARHQSTTRSVVDAPPAVIRHPSQHQDEIRTKKSKKKSLPKQVAALYAMAVLMVVGGLYTVVSSILTDRHITAKVQNMSQVQAASNVGADQPPAGSSLPSAERPTDEAYRSHKVAPEKPRYISIPSQSQKARVVPMGTKPDGQLASPSNIYDIGWFTGSNLPGQPGAMLLDGHRSSWKSNGTFYGLKKLKAGDKITIEKGDGTALTYSVVKSQMFDYDKVDMKSAMKSVDPTKPGLNMITCEGKVIPGTSEFDKRIIVYAVQD